MDHSAATSLREEQFGRTPRANGSGYGADGQYGPGFDANARNAFRPNEAL